jgi:hypothetical protein
MQASTTADHQILAILAKLEKTLNGDGVALEAAELEDVRAILKYRRTLVEIARYEEAKGLFWAHWRGLILAASAVLSALLMFWTNVEKIGVKIWGVFQ